MTRVRLHVDLTILGPLGDGSGQRPSGPRCTLRVGRVGWIDMPGATWWVKFRRAEKHLAELDSDWNRARDEPRPYSVETEVKAGPRGYWLAVWADIIDPIEDDFSAVVGDFIFNLRSALDHVTCAVTDRDDVQFPIFERDPWGAPDIGPDGKDRNKRRRDNFRKNTKGMPKAARAIYKTVQPYKNTPMHPENDMLAFLHRLSNADKHRTLTALAQQSIAPEHSFGSHRAASIPRDTTGLPKNQRGCSATTQ